MTAKGSCRVVGIKTYIFDVEASTGSNNDDDNSIVNEESVPAPAGAPCRSYTSCLVRSSDGDDWR